MRKFLLRSADGDAARRIGSLLEQAQQEPGQPLWDGLRGHITEAVLEHAQTFTQDVGVIAQNLGKAAGESVECPYVPGQQTGRLDRPRTT
jgi:hypothetical protein